MRQTERDCTPPRCPPNEDGKWERECRHLNAEAQWFAANGEPAAAQAAERGAAGAFCRITSPARQKRLAKELWEMRHAGTH